MIFIKLLSQLILFFFEKIARLSTFGYVLFIGCLVFSLSSFLGSFSNNLFSAEVTNAVVTNYYGGSKTSQSNELSSGGSNQLSEGFYSDPTLNRRHEGESFTFLWVKLIIIMVAFVGGCLLLIRFLKHRNPLGVNQEGNEVFESVAEYSLSANKSIKIVRVVNDYFILALSQDQITLINRVEDKETMDFLKLQSGKVSSKKFFFSDLINQYVGGNKGDRGGLSVTSGLKDRLSKGMMH